MKKPSHRFFDNMLKHTIERCIQSLVFLGAENVFRIMCLNLFTILPSSSWLNSQNFEYSNQITKQKKKKTKNARLLQQCPSSSFNSLDKVEFQERTRHHRDKTEKGL